MQIKSDQIVQYNVITTMGIYKVDSAILVLVG